MAAIPYSEMQPALAVLGNYHWSENVRELENVIERLVAISAQRMIGVDELPLDVVTVNHQVVDGVLTRGASLRQAKAEFERHYILRALEKSRWHQTRL
jgi:two-component system response regulator AtoC